MANEEHLSLLKQGVKTWNDWRSSEQQSKPDLRNANLNGADLSGANLNQADLSRANLRGSASMLGQRRTPKGILRQS